MTTFVVSAPACGDSGDDAGDATLGGTSGDGDPTGDGDPAGDGDPTGDGDSVGDGAGDPSGDGDGDPPPDPACEFALQSVDWPLPPGLGPDQLNDTFEDSDFYCQEGFFTVATLDLTGDGAPDLVQTDDCDVGGVGTANWLVYENTGSGFAPNPTSWALPPGLGPDQLNDTYEDSDFYCEEGFFTVATLDLADGPAPDLVLTDNCDVGGVGTTDWLVYTAGCG